MKSVSIFIVLTFLLLTIFSIATQVDAESTGTLTVYFDLPAGDIGLGGVKIHYGSEPATYSTVIDIGMATFVSSDGSRSQYKWTFTLPTGRKFLAATAYDTYGNETGYSNEIIRDIVSGLNQPINFKIQR